MRIEKRAPARALLAGILVAITASAAACGFCIEDRVAAVYDQALVDKSLAQHRYMAFFAIEGAVNVDEATRLALLAALNASGASRGSARLSLESAACSVAYDPAQTDLAKLAAVAGRALASRGLTLNALRIIDARGRLREP
jgi:hypothetical protein